MAMGNYRWVRVRASPRVRYLRSAFLFFAKNLKNMSPTVLHFGLAFWASCHLPSQAVHICKLVEHLANAISANPAVLPRHRDSSRHIFGDLDSSHVCRHLEFLRRRSVS